MNTNYVPAAAPTRRMERILSAVVLSLIAVTVLILAGAQVWLKTTARQAEITGYRAAAGKQAQTIDEALRATDDLAGSTDDAAWAAAAKAAAEAETAYGVLLTIDPPVRAAAFHAAMLDAYGSCVRAMRLNAAIDGKRDATLAWKPQIMALYDACHTGLTQLDSKTLTVNR